MIVGVVIQTSPMDAKVGEKRSRKRNEPCLAVCLLMRLYMERNCLLSSWQCNVRDIVPLFFSSLLLSVPIGCSRLYTSSQTDGQRRRRQTKTCQRWFQLIVVVSFLLRLSLYYTRLVFLSFLWPKTSFFLPSSSSSPWLPTHHTGRYYSIVDAVSSPLSGSPHQSTWACKNPGENDDDDEREEKKEEKRKENVCRCACYWRRAGRHRWGGASIVRSCPLFFFFCFFYILALEGLLPFLTLANVSRSAEHHPPPPHLGLQYFAFSVEGNSTVQVYNR